MKKLFYILIIGCFSFQISGQVEFTEQVLSDDTFSYLLSKYPIDFDGDGDIDFATENSDVWFENTGNKIFLKRTITAFPQASQGQYPQRFLLDFDSDGDQDFVWWTHTEGNYWIENLGNNNFTANVINIAGPLSANKPMDFDEDGDIDVFSFDYSTTPITIVLNKNDGNQNFVAEPTSYAVNFTTGYYDDIDQDNDNDIIKVNFSSTLEIHENDGANNYTLHTIDNLPTTSIFNVSIEDLDSDGDKDIFLVQANNNPILGSSVVWYENTQGFNFVRHELATISDNTDIYQDCYFKDMNNDSYLDIVCTGLNVTGHFLWFENDGNQNYTKHTVDPNTSSSSGSVHVADVNNDTFQDFLVVARTNSSPYRVRSYINDGNGNFTMHIKYLQNAISSSWDKATSVVDIDNDTDLDFIFFSEDGKIVLLENTLDPVIEPEPLGKCYNEFENSNWISNCSFDLQGRLTSSGVSYFNNLGKATQSQTTDIKTGRVWASQTLYDYQGRPAFQSLSAPVDSINYGYKNFVVKDDGYSLNVLDVESITEANTNLPQVSTQEGTLGWYYSENNDREPYQDVTAHPYSKSVYSRLNPGTVLKTLGGNKFTVDGEEEWLNGYSFTMPAAQELFYAFGKDHFPVRDALNTTGGGIGFTGNAFCTISPLNSTTEYKVVVTSLNGTQLAINDVYDFDLSNGLSGVYKLISVDYENDLLQDCLADEQDQATCEYIVGQIKFGYGDAEGDVEGYLGTPYYIKATKTVSRDVHGVETVVFTDADGNTLAAARSGNEEGNTLSYKVVSTIGEQDYVDIHIPVGADGVLTFDGMQTDVAYHIYDLVSEELVAENITSSTYTIAPGMYRIERVLVDGTNNLPVGTPSYVTIENNQITLLNPTMSSSVSYNVNYYEYSLNYYDKANRLTKSVQPLGFDSSNLISKTFNTPNHSLLSVLKYNTINRLQETTNPDEGTTKFKYRRDGQIRFSQNSKQVIANKFSYTNYDDLSRPIESGVLQSEVFSTIDPDIKTLPSATKSEVHHTIYDTPDVSSLHAALNTAAIPTSAYAMQRFVSGNVVKTSTQNPSTAASWYSYDVYGRVEWMVQYIVGIGVKTIDYEYDQTTGEVTKVCYQKHVPAEMFIHKYTYNFIGELVQVETSTDNLNFINQAKYSYYETGALKRTELADNLQGIDYTYNLAGRLKAINSPNIGANDASIFKDPGNDGANGFAQDVFGMTLDYYKDDYKRINTPSTLSSVQGGIDQFNGNIKAMAWQTAAPNIANAAAYYYQYNKNNWLESASFTAYDQLAATAPMVETLAVEETQPRTVAALESIILLPGFETQAGTPFEAKITEAPVVEPSPAKDYDVTGITYDANGNIQSLNRNKHTENGSNAMDQLTYKYYDDPADYFKPNQLSSIVDGVTTPTNANDIKTQEEGNYEYNDIGQLVDETDEFDNTISYKYNASGLVTEVQKEGLPMVKFYYNDKGHRVRKESFTNGNLIDTEHYVRDASGLALAIYKNGILTEVPIYGVGRIGIHYKTSGTDVFQLTDHLGNVRGVVLKDGQNAISLTSSTDYYPFGMAMPGRQTIGGETYRYAFQGKEKDPETGKEAFELRLWDGRIGRWLSPDPAGQYDSPYLGMGNNPVNGVDPDGGCFVKNDDQSYSECAKAKVGSTRIGAFGNSWTFDKNDGWQLTNGADPSTVDASFSPVRVNGKEDYYIKRYKKHIEDFNTRPPDYYLGYGHKYINRFRNETASKLSEDGKEWLDHTAYTLQDLMEAGIRNNPLIQLDNSKFLSFAYDTHVPAYLSSGLANLPISDLKNIGLTPDAKDLFSSDGIKQALIVEGALVRVWTFRALMDFGIWLNRKVHKDTLD